MKVLASKTKSYISEIIKLEDSILKEYIQSYYWLGRVKSKLGKLVWKIGEYLAQSRINSSNTELDLSSCLHVHWQVTSLDVNYFQPINVSEVGEHLGLPFCSEQIYLKNIELFIDDIGRLVSDIKITFSEREKEDWQSDIKELKQLYITPKQLTKLNDLDDLVTDLVEEAIEEYRAN